MLAREKKKIRKCSVKSIVQPGVPNNSNSLPRVTTDEMGKVKREIVAVTTKEEEIKPKVDTGYGKDIKGKVYIKKSK